MITRTHTLAFEGIEPRLIEVQCALAPGAPAFQVVGLADKAVSEARERVRAALAALSIALPSRRITVNLAPADLPKEGNHFDLPIALALLAALGLAPPDQVARLLSLGELSLDGRLAPITGALPAALAAAEAELTLILPAACGREGAWVSAAEIIAPETLGALLRHLGGQAPLAPLLPPDVDTIAATPPDLVDLRGQERARRALEIAAAGRHNLLLLGPPGTGKSMLARRLPGILPALSPAEALETALVLSLAGGLPRGQISRAPPFRAPHHGASRAAMTGGGRDPRPGELSLAHNGVLFLDELPEFQRDVLESLRTPLETGEIHVARANAHLRYPARIMLVAAANPCRCGHLGDPARACARAPRCGADYLARISGPLLDRFDLRVEMAPEPWQREAGQARPEASAPVAARVLAARMRQQTRHDDGMKARSNAEIEGRELQALCALDRESEALLHKVVERFTLSARGHDRILRLARTIADLEGTHALERHHIAEAASFRLTLEGQR